MASLLRGRHLPLYNLLSAHKKEKKKEKRKNVCLFFMDLLSDPNTAGKGAGGPKYCT